MGSERWGIVVGVLGLGATLLTAALALGGVEVTPFLLWAMGVLGALLMFIGSYLALVPVTTAVRGRLRRASASPVAQLPELAHTRSEPSPPARKFDAELRALLIAGRNVSDSYQWSTSFSHQWDEATRKEHLLWTRDTVSTLRQCDPAVAKRFESAKSHDERLTILADYLGVEKE